MKVSHIILRYITDQITERKEQGVAYRATGLQLSRPINHTLNHSGELRAETFTIETCLAPRF